MIVDRVLSFPRLLIAELKFQHEVNSLRESPNSQGCEMAKRRSSSTRRCISEGRRKGLGTAKKCKISSGVATFFSSRIVTNYTAQKLEGWKVGNSISKRSGYERTAITPAHLGFASGKLEFHSAPILIQFATFALELPLGL